MSSSYKPPQSTVVAQVRTAADDLRASFHIPKDHGFADHLGKFAFWNLTNVTVQWAPEPLPFFSLRAAAALIVIPEGDEADLRLAPAHGPTDKHRIACLLESGAVTGDIELPPGARVSDYLAHHAGFFLLRNARLDSQAGKAPLVLVNAAALVGVSEPGPAPA